MAVLAWPPASGLISSLLADLSWMQMLLLAAGVMTMNPKSRWSCIQQACRIPLYTCMHGVAYLMRMKAEWMKLATMAVRPVPGAGFACTCWRLEQSAQQRKQNRWISECTVCWQREYLG